MILLQLLNIFFYSHISIDFIALLFYVTQYFKEELINSFGLLQWSGNPTHGLNSSLPSFHKRVLDAMIMLLTDVTMVQLGAHVVRGSPVQVLWEFLSIPINISP